MQQINPQTSSPTIAEILAETTRLQGNAANPQTSAFVSANAGTGKTHVLVNRVLRLLLSGSEPFRILCLTYTKAAAAEMSNRLFRTLAAWVTLPEADLKAALVKLTNTTPDQETLDAARRLFAKAIETPGGMKVQTIHGFCEKLLQRFPLEAGVPAHFNVLDDVASNDLMNQAIADVLHRALTNPESREAEALATVTTHATDLQFEEHIRAAIRHRQSWGAAFTDAPKDMMATLTTILDLPENKDPAHWQQAMAASVSNELADALIPILIEAGGTTNENTAKHLKAARSAKTTEAKTQALRLLFLTQKQEKRKSLATNAVKNPHPALADRLSAAQDTFYEAFTAYESITVARATLELLTLADKIITRFEQQKQQRAALDYQDLIEYTARLLHSRHDTAWVLYKLDRGLDHILVDEAQDTSPDQWQVIASLTEEFFSGSGASEKNRTLFAVGDEKQSIYGFQGAEPRQFGEMASHFGNGAALAEKEFAKVPLNLSFRSTRAVLDAVDLVFADPSISQSVTVSGEPILHHANRQDSPGLVEIWPTERQQKSEQAEAFAPLDDDSIHSVSQRLARKIARQIKTWLETKETLHSKGRPIRAGDILILLRKRNPFAPLMIRALKAEGIPVSGADRIVITEQLAVMDMMALADFLLLPEDDLALASLLKSPLFNLTDDDLFTLSHQRKGSLWQSLRYFAKRDARFEPVAATLSLWLSRADILPPFEFFANLLEGEGLRKKFIARLGAVAGDALDEFLNLALQYDEQEPPSMQGFLAWLRRADAEIKRDMEKGRDEVRVMTVHGAKGLEAEIVFLPDTCSNRSASQSDSIITTRSGSGPESRFNNRILWSLAGKNHLTPIRQMRDARNMAESDEQLRLLYVAMTRARDRLYVAGFEGVKGRSNGCWYDLINDALAEKLQTVTLANGETVSRLESGTPAPIAVGEAVDEVATAASQPAPQPLPSWYTEKAASEPVRTIPVAPSSVIPYETPDDDEDKLPVEPAVMSPQTLGSDARFIRGRLVHKLLEYLPDIPPQERRRAAETLARHHGRELKPQARTAIINETMAIIENDAYADLFGPGSKAEVSLIARITPKKSGKTPILLSGQIDRLVVRDNEVMIIDYKSNRPSPRQLEDVADAYKAQLAAYRIALRQIYPGHTLRAALLWTDGPFLMEIPAEALDPFDAILNQSGEPGL